MENQVNQTVVVTPTKSMGVAIILSIFFGSLGMFYSTIPGGIVMTIISLIAAFIAFITLGFGLVLFIIIWPVEIIWAAAAVNSYNKKMLISQQGI